jgi:hypothetical protein
MPMHGCGRQSASAWQCCGLSEHLSKQVLDILALGTVPRLSVLLLVQASSKPLLSSCLEFLCRKTLATAH